MKQILMLTAVCAVLALGLVSCHHHGHHHHDRQTQTRYEIYSGKPGVRPPVARPGVAQPPPPAPRR